MFIDEDDTGSDGGGGPEEIAARDVLAACAVESARQADVMARLDASIGSALAILRRQPEGQRSPPSDLVIALQQADRLRQEMDGLAQVLALLSGLGSQGGTILASRVRACTPFRDLQDRLLSAAPPLGAAERRQRAG